MNTSERTTRTHFGFIGLGLIGGSIARCIRAALPGADIIAYNYYDAQRHPRLELALSDGILSRIISDLEDLSSCDIIFLCAPVLTNMEYLKKIKPYLKDDCILTDVGSIKKRMHQAVQDEGLEHYFIGGHPMAGTEMIGYEHSFADLLKGCYYILTPTAEVPSAHLKWMENFVANIIHAKYVTIDVEEHDQATAGISHAPHIVSAALVNTVHARDHEGIYQLLAAGGFKDITRISSSSPEMWQNICLANKEAVLDFLDEYERIFADARRMIEEEDAEGILSFFANAKKYRDKLLK